MMDPADRQEMLKEAYREALKQCEILKPLADYPLHRGAAAHLITLWSPLFVVTETNSAWVVSGVDGASVNDAVSRLLQTDEYSWFLKDTAT